MTTSDPIELRPLGDPPGYVSSTNLPSTGFSSSSRQVPPPPRHKDAQPGTLGQGYRTAEDIAKAIVKPKEGDMDNYSTFGLVASCWFGALSLPLLILPRLVLFLSQGPDSASSTRNLQQNPLNVLTPGGVPSYDRGYYDALTALESLTLRLLGFGLIALALISLFVVVPSYTTPAGASSTANPGRLPTIGVIAALGSISAIVSWNSPLGALATIVGLGNGVIGAWGWWAVFFGSETRAFKKYLKPNSRMKRL